MGSTPPFKIINPNGEYVASCKYAEDAAAFIGILGEGSRVLYRHSLPLWFEGREAIPAAESYDQAAQIMHKRIDTAFNDKRR